MIGQAFIALAGQTALSLAAAGVLNVATTAMGTAAPLPIEQDPTGLVDGFADEVDGVVALSSDRGTATMTRARGFAESFSAVPKQGSLEGLLALGFLVATGAWAIAALWRSSRREEAEPIFEEIGRDRVVATGTISRHLSADDIDAMSAQLRKGRLSLQDLDRVLLLPANAAQQEQRAALELFFEVLGLSTLQPGYYQKAWEGIFEFLSSFPDERLSSWAYKTLRQIVRDDEGRFADRVVRLHQRLMRSRDPVVREEAEGSLIVLAHSNRLASDALARRRAAKDAAEEAEEARRTQELDALLKNLERQ